MQKIKSDVPSRGELERLQVAMEDSHKTKDGINMNTIEKQKRGWEEAREKAEEMSQIFDSLIITSEENLLVYKTVANKVFTHFR